MTCDSTGHGSVSSRQEDPFWRVIELVTHLLEACDERNLLRIKSQLAKLELLVLEELGYVPTSKVGAEIHLRCDQQGIRTDQHHRDHQSAVRAMGRGSRQ